MDKSQTSPSIEDDVLHNPDHSRLTPEEIAKAIAHHKKNHPEGSAAKPSPKQSSGQSRPNAGQKPGGGKIR